MSKDAKNFLKIDNNLSPVYAVIQNNGEIECDKIGFVVQLGGKKWVTVTYSTRSK